MAQPVGEPVEATKVAATFEEVAGIGLRLAQVPQGHLEDDQSSMSETTHGLPLTRHVGEKS